MTVKDEEVAQIADLLRQRNAIDERIAQVINRPMTSGHLGEWIASRVFDIELEASASKASIDGRFRTGPLQGKSVNVKWYTKREGLLDMISADVLDYYLVMTGPSSTAMSSAGTTRPWRIENVYLFDARQLRNEQQSRGVKVGVASSVPRRYWTEAEIYPEANNPLFNVTPEQAYLLELFSAE